MLSSTECQAPRGHWGAPRGQGHRPALKPLTALGPGARSGRVDKSPWGVTEGHMVTLTGASVTWTVLRGMPRGTSRGAPQFRLGFVQPFFSRSGWGCGFWDRRSQRGGAVLTASHQGHLTSPRHRGWCRLPRVAEVALGRSPPPRRPLSLSALRPVEAGL